MKVYFVKTLEKVAQAGEVKEVADGFARNFLIPKGYALPWTEGLAKHLEEIKRQKEAKTKRLLKIAFEEAKKVNGTELEFSRRANEEGLLYGSVRAEDIKQSLREKFDLKTEFDVELDEPIRKAGTWNVSVVFMKKHRAKVKVIVNAIKEKSQ